MSELEKQYLELLSRVFPSAEEAATEIINRTAALNLPKETEFFASDIHGEYEAFSHVLRNASGTIRDYIEEALSDTASAEEKRALATLIYYPQQKLALVHDQEEDLDAWYSTTLARVIMVTLCVIGKDTDSFVRKALPKEHARVMQKLLFEDPFDKESYYVSMIDAVIETGMVPAIIEAFCELIKRMAVDRLHVVGDIYDRGPEPHTIMDLLMEYHNVDIQWGNHDVVWMGAALGQRGCIAHVVRNCARYGNLSILEDSYGINLAPLASFALSAYAKDPCVGFGLKGNPDLSPAELDRNVKIQKAMAILQFKVEAQLIAENPSFGLEDRNLLHQIDFDKGTVMLDGKEYQLTDTVFPTVDPADPYRLTAEEEEVMQRLEEVFLGCEKLQRHMEFFLEAGGLYKVYNGNLLLHACVPLNADGSLKEVTLYGETLKGRALYDAMEQYVRDGFYATKEADRKRGRDIMWYLWLGEGSPLFAKSKMATFEIYLIAEKEARKEVKNPFYSLLDNEAVFDAIFEDFGLDPETAHIVCGHVPVKVKDGEDPVKCNGRVLAIDGGFSKAYQPTTGIAGYTLVSASDALTLYAHQPLESLRAAIEEEADIVSDKRVVEEYETPLLVADTDRGERLNYELNQLYRLLDAYREGHFLEGTRDSSC